MSVPKGFPDIRGFMPVSLNEWDAHIACILFLNGCNLRCPFCHGWRFVKENANLPPVSFDEMESSLESNRGWVEGAVVSGGEPTISPGLSVLIDWLRNQHALEIKLHTNGMNPRVLSLLLAQKALACVALDFKAQLNREAYRRATAIPKLVVDGIRESFRLAGACGLPVEFHTTLCPTALSLDDLEPMAGTLAEVAPHSIWYLQQYNPGDVLDPKAAGSEVWSLDDIEDRLPVLRRIHPNIELRG